MLIFSIVLDGGWSSWSSWRACSQECGGGYKIRTRSCDSPAPKYGGADCKGSHYETTTCNVKRCPGNDGLFLLKVT